MANFGVHAAGAAAAGIGCGALSLAVFAGKNPAFAGAAAVAAFVGGMLPDIDHDEAIPIREVFSLLAAVVPAMLLPVMARHGFSTEELICFFAAVYVTIRFVVAEAFKRLTVHRGIFHSIPFIVAAGEAVALGLMNLSPPERLLIGASVTIGAFTHLLLDEIYAVDFTGRKLKKSFGTAIKFWSPDLAPTLLCYAALALLTLIGAVQIGPQLLAWFQRR